MIGCCRQIIIIIQVWGDKACYNPNDGQSIDHECAINGFLGRMFEWSLVYFKGIPHMPSCFFD